MKRLDHPNSQMAVKANTVLKVLKGSSLELLDILMRESIQNSLDASDIDSEEEYITFSYQAKSYDNSRILLKSLSFLKMDENDNLFNRLGARILNCEPAILILSDKGTTGLSGPVKRIDPDWKRTDLRKNFDNLVYELGQNHGADKSGGSFGFGKSVYYQISSVGLVMYYSGTRAQTGLEERLAFCLISNDECNNNSTGISWWGDIYDYENTKYAAPLTDSGKISGILENLNLDNLKFNENQYGTHICIICPDLNKLDSRTISELKTNVEETVGKWYWPRMMETGKVKKGGDIRPLKFVSDGKMMDITIANTKKGELLLAAEKAIMGLPDESRDIERKLITHTYGGNVTIGALAFRIFDIGLDAENSGLNTIAMIRAPRMVVYEQKVPVQENRFFSAVFLVNSDLLVYKNQNDYDDRHLQNKRVSLDNAFRDCESSTHSEWNSQNIDPESKFLKYYVNKGLKESYALIEKALQPQSREPETSSDWAGYAILLGKLLLTDDSGFVDDLPIGQNTSTRSQTRTPKIKITDQKFTVDKKIIFNLEISNIPSDSYRISLIARGGRENLDMEQWENKLGGEFPFKIIGSVSENLEIIKQESGKVIIKGDNTENTKKLNLTINPEKRDALINFRIEKM